MKPDVSFLIQNKNYGRYLSQCLKSILNQSTDFTYQIIGLDAGSTDNSREIYKKILGSYVDVTGCNQAEALNIGLKLTEGKYIGWINSDDYYKPNYVETHIALFEKFKHNNIVLTFAERLPFVESNDLSFRITRLKQLFFYLASTKHQNWILHKLAENNYNPIKIIQKILNPPYISKRTPFCIPKRTFYQNFNINNFREEYVHNPAAMFKSDTIRQIGGWNEKLQFCIDDDLFIRLAQIGNIAYTPRYTAVCRIHSKNMSALNFPAQELEVKTLYNQCKNIKLGELFIAH